MLPSALVLAGGRSERFGRPKALVEMLGRPLVAHVAAALAPLAEDIIVSVADDETAGTIEEALPHVRFVVDQRWSAGPIEGFRQGFRVAHGAVVLVAPCDAPFLRTELYRLLLSALGDSDAAVPRRSVFDPVRAAYRRSPVVHLLESPADVPSPSALVDLLHPVFLDESQLRTADPELASFFDVNTPADLEKARERMQSTASRWNRA